MLSRYSDTVWPLNLDDHELLGDPGTLQEARSKLTADGWNPDGLYCSTTWCRMRYMASVIQEMIIVHDYQPLTDASTRELLMLYDQLNTFWDSIPQTLRYKPEVWHTTIPPRQCLMLAVVYLLHLQSNFRIHRKLMRSDPVHAEKALEFASLIVGTVNHLSQVRDRSVFLRFDNSYVMLDYGLSAAAMMVEAVSRKGVPSWPQSISRSKLIRELSVLVSNLESICQPGESNYAVCTRAARKLSRALDEILDPDATTIEDGHSRRSGPVGTGDSSTHTTATSEPATDNFASDMMPGEHNGLGGLDFSDLDSWLRSVDWTEVGADYIF
ncbi:hypothetical protein CBER1_06536 [Cercospora berteroae]|uniref:Transcription factor domain-containing protein n=1 Tax=Cercospora berteroae TaxID=357750 RepID=A0A2S6BTY1_9PEZI|nr:hypothetical protein CBER1_06536 [Cercospora berteroae]